MEEPSGPHVKTVYNLDGSIVVTPTGFGGSMCKAATEPYLKKQGKHTLQPTDEAQDPVNKAWLKGQGEGERAKVKA